MEKGTGTLILGDLSVEMKHLFDSYLKILNSCKLKIKIKCFYLLIRKGEPFKILPLGCTNASSLPK